MIASALGARVIAVDRSPVARERARELGAEVTLEDGPDPAHRISGITGGGARISIDAVGSIDTALASIASLRPRGRHIQVGLLLSDDASPALPMGQVIAKELEIYGSPPRRFHGGARRRADDASSRSSRRERNAER
jgi:alcohol dehydrogenase